jgi:hypothetical protein
VTPILKWNTGEEMNQVARNVLEHGRLYGQLPSGEAWFGLAGSVRGIRRLTCDSIRGGRPINSRCFPTPWPSSLWGRIAYGSEATTSA